MISHFSKYVNMYNSKQTNLDQVISIKKVSLSLNDGWLSGFIDAEGSFRERAKKRLKLSLQEFYLHSFKKMEVMLYKEILTICNTLVSF